MEKELPTASPLGKLVINVYEASDLPSCQQLHVVCQFQHASYRITSVEPKEEQLLLPMRVRSRSGNDHKDEIEPVAARNFRINGKTEFDVVDGDLELTFSLYDVSQDDVFLGRVCLLPDITKDKEKFDSVHELQPLFGAANDPVTGSLSIAYHFTRDTKKSVSPEDFQILKLVGKGASGQVYQVRKTDTRQLYAMKVLSKKTVVHNMEVKYALGERNILVRNAVTDSPFVLGLKFAFQTPSHLVAGGELFWHLQKEGQFPESHGRFYAAAIILALRHLHAMNIIYRDLKPENVLLDVDGHIVLCDFGLSKSNVTRTDTADSIIGTTEYLAPEVLLDENGYTAMVDFWSLGVLIFEMICGWSPFYASDTPQLYKNIAFGKVRFPRDALSKPGRDFVKGLLNRNPKNRLGAVNDAQDLMEHAWFEDFDWKALETRQMLPPFRPKIRKEAETTTFDPEFTAAIEDSSGSLNARAMALAGAFAAFTPLSPTVQQQFKGFTFVEESRIDDHLASDRWSDEDKDVDDLGEDFAEKL